MGAEAPEFRSDVLETLRQPLELGELVLHRTGGAARYPARFQLVLAANPCPCGMAVGKGLECSCSPTVRRRYLARLSGPLLDRVDVQVEVERVERVDRFEGTSESTADVAARVLAAREAARGRLTDTPWSTNAEMPGRFLRELLRPRRSLFGPIERAMTAGTLSLRGVDRVLRMAWTVADLAGRDAPTKGDVGNALLLRTRGDHG
ncbi:ATP-binding protein [Promicromonospora citrea]|uniref:Magnesium chelatase subunit ChlI-like protein n=1 Tax=Promicromonospora citrea TaxID=43677 RepID=A0A8H9GFZ9_9MICO|nr:ATP-binding protein [Promicromonospora citrea]GGM22133.1 hypothetical protein GCM10010102_17260 [Promicromonospora citrea]